MDVVQFLILLPAYWIYIAGIDMRGSFWIQDNMSSYITFQAAFSLTNTTNEERCAMHCMGTSNCVSFIINFESHRCTGYILKQGTSVIPISETEKHYIKELYEFDVHNFTNCGKTGNTGPILSLCVEMYQTASWINIDVFNVLNGVQKWLVPETTNYIIEAAGAAGGRGEGGEGGNGAKIKGTFYLNRGTIINIVCGQKGGNSGGSEPAGGGGGTFVYTGEIGGDGLLIAAGGGGGGGEENTNAGYNGQSGDEALTYSGLVGINGANNGGIGYGGVGGRYSVAGAGWHSDGESINSGNPGTRWTGGAEPSSDTGAGGFGGGASGRNSNGGGGGGGYTGGWGSDNSTRTNWGGSGAGSFNKGNDQINITGYNSGHGYVTITML